MGFNKKIKSNFGVCLNCGTQLVGKYCHNCGQEHRLYKHSSKQTFSEFFEDLTFFNKKVGKTLKLVLSNPAKLAKDYINGKRATYIAPLKLYLFLATLFSVLNYLQVAETSKDIASKDLNLDFSNVVQNDSINKRKIEESWLIRKLDARIKEIVVEYNENPEVYNQKIFSKFEALTPYLTYLLIPFIAILFNLFYRKSGYYYIEHLTLTIYLFSLSTISDLLTVIINYVLLLTHSSLLDNFNFLDIIFFLYFVYALKIFYQQGVLKTIVKTVLINTLLFFALIIMIVVGFIIILFIV